MLELAIKGSKKYYGWLAVLLGATAFSLVLRGLGGDELIEGALLSLPFDATGIVICMLGLLYLNSLGWIEWEAVNVPATYLGAHIVGGLLLARLTQSMVLRWGRTLGIEDIQWVARLTRIVVLLAAGLVALQNLGVDVGLLTTLIAVVLRLLLRAAPTIVNQFGSIIVRS